jgi:Ser/Thr protein kinase RdoA (MazF antagonist)
MRYGLDNNRKWKKDRMFFPVQSSVLDEEVLLSEAAIDYCIPEPYSCRFLSRGDSDIYRVRTATRDFYLKIYRPPKSLELTEAEGLFVWSLSESGIPVVKPVARTDGQFAHHVFAPDGIRPMLLYEEAPPPLPSKLDEEISSVMGEKVALFHTVADGYDTSFDIPEININTFFDEKIYYTSQFLSESESTYLEDVRCV